MNRRKFLGGLAALLPSLRVSAEDIISEVNGGGGAIWRQKSVNVHVFADPGWHFYIMKSFVDLKRISGKRLPRFNLVFHPREDCDKLNAGDFGNATMVWCSKRDINSAEAYTSTVSHRHSLNFVKIVLREDSLTTQSADYNQNTTHHELMHGVTWVNDSYGTHPANSAVHGDLPSYGAHDKKLIQKMYRKNRKKHRRR